MVASPEVVFGLIWCCSLTVASVLEVFGSWLSCFGWLGAGLRDGCGDCLLVLVARWWAAGGEGWDARSALGCWAFWSDALGVIGLVFGCLDGWDNCR